MIDFYKRSVLSVLGKEAGSMQEIDYYKKVVSVYEEYLTKLKENKGKAKEDSQELYL